MRASGASSSHARLTARNEVREASIAHSTSLNTAGELA